MLLKCTLNTKSSSVAFLRLGSQNFELWSQTELRPLPHLPASLPLLPTPLNPLPCQLLPALIAHLPWRLPVSLGLLPVPPVQADSAFPTLVCSAPPIFPAFHPCLEAQQGTYPPPTPQHPSCPSPPLTLLPHPPVAGVPAAVPGCLPNSLLHSSLAFLLPVGCVLGSVNCAYDIARTNKTFCCPPHQWATTVAGVPARGSCLPNSLLYFSSGFLLSVWCVLVSVNCVYILDRC